MSPHRSDLDGAISAGADADIGRHDVVVVGDGPAGSALAHALTRLGVDVVLVGTDRDWAATYGTWSDDVDACDLLGGADVWQHRLDSVAVRFDALRTVARPYGVVDNAALKSVLREGVEWRLGEVRRVEDLDARIVVDATGWPSGLAGSARAQRAAPSPTVAWQTAFGVVLAEPPEGPLGSPTLMDWSEPPGRPIDVGVPTFAYALPVAEGWLVEETVLTASPAVDPALLVGRLAARLSCDEADLRRRALRVETVHIPMGIRAPTPREGLARRNAVVGYGAAAGMIHPATGYSIASAITRAEPVAAALGSLLDVGGPIDRRRLDAAVWPTAMRRTRRLHDYGSDVLAEVDGDGIRSFFSTFFDLPESQWSAYLRIDTGPARTAAVMAAMFRRAPWSLRRTLVSRNPLPLLGALRR